MATRSDDLRREILALPGGERAALAAELLVSLEEPAEQDLTEVHAHWAAEIERRAQRVAAAETTGQDWLAVRQRLADTLDG